MSWRRQLPTLSRFAVMQHLGVLTDAGLVVARQRGRYRFNHLNPVPLRRWYERWVVPLADGAAAEMLALERTLAADQQRGGDDMSVQAPVEEIAAPADGDQFRTVRIETELRFRATPERVWEAITERSLEWFPTTYGEERVQLDRSRAAHRRPALRGLGRGEGPSLRPRDRLRPAVSP